jgi:hypothetical protein
MDRAVIGAGVSYLLTAKDEGEAGQAANYCPPVLKRHSFSRANKVNKSKGFSP